MVRSQSSSVGVESRLLFFTPRDIEGSAKNRDPDRKGPFKQIQERLGSLRRNVAASRRPDEAERIAARIVRRLETPPEMAADLKRAMQDWIESHLSDEERGLVAKKFHAPVERSLSEYVEIIGEVLMRKDRHLAEQFASARVNRVVLIEPVMEELIRWLREPTFAGIGEKEAIDLVDHIMSSAADSASAEFNGTTGDELRQMPEP